MAVYELTLPLDDATVEKLQVGDIIYLNGQVCTARDIAHLKLRELADAGKPFPEDLRGGALFHAGPVMKKDAQGKWYLSVIGPTTSIRMEPHADFVGQQGVKVIIGKGGMGDGTKAALQKYKQVYVQACPGCAVVLAAGIVGTKEPHWFEHGMPEAMWPLQAKHFGPFLVTMDSHGNSRYDKVRDYAQKVEKEILATKFAFLMGSGNAPFYSFASIAPAIAEKFGVHAADVLLPLQTMTGFGRTMSPVTGGIVAVAGMAGVSPFRVVKRNMVPLLCCCVVNFLVVYLFILP